MVEGTDADAGPRCDLLGGHFVEAPPLHEVFPRGEDRVHGRLSPRLNGDSSSLERCHIATVARLATFRGRASSSLRPEWSRPPSAAPPGGRRRPRPRRWVLLHLLVAAAAAVDDDGEARPTRRTKPKPTRRNLLRGNPEHYSVASATGAVSRPARSSSPATRTARSMIGWPAHYQSNIPR